ncbi:MAG TPA: RNase adapter RapZ [Alphaproteobacteria bacterium]|nr:RNase adapter RapZ [Alphaproteobacteria bacterium]
MSAPLAKEASSASAAPARRPVAIVTGMSGAGKSTALKALEDSGYEAVDNLPLSLLVSLVRPEDGVGRPIAVGVDTRTRDFSVAAFDAAIDRLRAEPSFETRLVFLDSEDEVLRRRFTETRRRHPLAADRPVTDGIRAERDLIVPLRGRADLVIDTSTLSGADLKRLVQEHFGLGARAGMAVSVISFAYRHGLPREADLVFDIRFLANPHYRPELQALSGRDGAVAAFIARDAAFQPFFEGLTTMLRTLLPRFESEGKSYLTIAVGCTGGRHRSVFVAERLAEWLGGLGRRVNLIHRDIERGGSDASPPAGAR